jgi:hypothetical protein
MSTGFRKLAHRLLPTALVCGALSVTVGWVIEEPADNAVETEAVGVLREVEPSRDARALASALARSPVIAQELRRSRTFLERPATLARAVGVSVDFPRLVIRVRDPNGEYAALLANRWMDAIDTVFQRLVAGAATERRAIIARVRANDPSRSLSRAALPLIRRERARSVVTGAPVSTAAASGSAAHLEQFGVPRVEPLELVATVAEAEPPGPPPTPSFARFLLWLAGGIAVGVSIVGLSTLILRRVGREAGA